MACYSKITGIFSCQSVQRLPLSLKNSFTVIKFNVENVIPHVLLAAMEKKKETLCSVVRNVQCFKKVIQLCRGVHASILDLQDVRTQKV